MTEQSLRDLLAPYVQGLALPHDVYARCLVFLDLLLRWNTRTNLTAIRDPDTLVQRQFGESLYAARYLPDSGTLLDFGSGAGFPGIPMLLAKPGLTVMLAESQGKKASFLREAVRCLELTCEVWAGRVEALPLQRQFGTVTMRAVDHSTDMLSAATQRIEQDGALLRFTSRAEEISPVGWQITNSADLPKGGRVEHLQRKAVFHVEQR